MALKRVRDRRSARFEIDTPAPEKTEGGVALAPKSEATPQAGSCPGCASDEESAFLRHGPDCPDIVALCQELTQEVTADKEPAERRRFGRGMALFMVALFLFPVLLESSTALLGPVGWALSLFFMFASIGGAIALARAKKES